MNSLEKRLIREARRHALLLLLSVTLAVCAVIGAAIGYQEQCGLMVGICGLAVVIFALQSIYHASESARHMRLHDTHIQFSQPSGNGNPNAARDAEQI